MRLARVNRIYSDAAVFTNPRYRVFRYRNCYPTAPTGSYAPETLFCLFSLRPIHLERRTCSTVCSCFYCTRIPVVRLLLFCAIFPYTHCFVTVTRYWDGVIQWIQPVACLVTDEVLYIEYLDINSD